MPSAIVKIRAPGRVCFFGEHQDYLRLPVISASISLYIELEAREIPERELRIDLLDLKQQEMIPLTNREVQYQYSRDYLRSAYNLFIRNGYRLNQGYHCKIRGDIPIGAGAASSTALVIAWITFLEYIFAAKLGPERVANLGYQAEVDEFREAGGRMDHYTSALGGILNINNTPPYNYERFNTRLSGLILGDSLQRKYTVSDLKNVKEQVMICLSEMRRIYPEFDLKTANLDEIQTKLDSVLPEVARKVRANVINRLLTEQARMLFTSGNFSPDEFGNLLNLHHEQLADSLGVSTPKIEKLITEARKAGALGCKINGSGFGGSLVAYAPDNTQNVARAIEKAGGKAYMISISRGCELSKLES